MATPVLLVLLGCLASPALQTSQPNILLILADDLGYNDVPWHNPTIIAPHLASLARDGTILTQNYVQPKCAPSRAALLSGRYPYRTGRQHESLPPQMPTGLSTRYQLLPELLARAGYTSHLVGKWHLGYCAWDYTPTRRGFHSFFGFYTHGADYYDREASDSGGQFRGYDLRDGELVTREGEGEYSAHLFSRKAAEVVKQQADKDKPYFLYLSLQSIHKPVQVPDQYARLYQPYGRLTRQNRRLGMITALDEAVANVTAAVRAEGGQRDTVTIFLSDNGGAERGANWPLRGGKNSVWEGGTRTPAFIHRWGGGKGSTSYSTDQDYGGLVHIVDWLPTILGLAGAPAPPGTDGVDQWEAISGKAAPPRTELVYNINTALRFTAAIRSRDWKLIWGYPEGLRSDAPRKATRAAFAQTMAEARGSDLLYLFNLRKDPGETVNLAGQYRQVTRVMMKKIRRIMKSGAVVRPDTPFLREKSLPRYWNGTVSPGWCRAN